MKTEKISPTSSTNKGNTQTSPHISSQQPGKHHLRRWLVTHTYASTWLPARLRSWFVGYILAVLLQVLVFFSVMLFIPIYPNLNFIEAPVLLVVLCLSFLWGNGPGILATLVGTLLLFILQISPYFPVEVKRLEDVVSIVLYLGI